MEVQRIFIGVSCYEFAIKTRFLADLSTLAGGGMSGLGSLRRSLGWFRITFSISLFGACFVVTQCSFLFIPLHASVLYTSDWESLCF